MIHYRDSETGRFVSRITWTRSRAHGGSRFKRQSERPKVAAKRHEPRKAQPKAPKFFGVRTKEAGAKLPVVQVIAEIPKPGNLQTWVEIKTLISHVSLYLPANVTYNETIHTPGYVMLDEWLSERRILETEIKDELGESWEIIALWNVVAFEPEGMNIQAEIPE